jgi:hypothetical protein
MDEVTKHGTAMKLWQKVIVVLLLSAFPGGIAVFIKEAAPRHEATPAPRNLSVADLVNAKAKSFDDVAMKIATAQGEILKLEKTREDMLVELHDIRDEVDGLIRRATERSGPDSAMFQVKKPRLSPR